MTYYIQRFIRTENVNPVYIMNYNELFEHKSIPEILSELTYYMRIMSFCLSPIEWCFVISQQLSCIYRTMPRENSQAKDDFMNILHSIAKIVLIFRDKNKSCIAAPRNLSCITADYADQISISHKTFLFKQIFHTEMIRLEKCNMQTLYLNYFLDFMQMFYWSNIICVTSDSAQFYEKKFPFADFITSCLCL